MEKNDDQTSTTKWLNLNIKLNLIPERWPVRRKEIYKEMPSANKYEKLVIAGFGRKALPLDGLGDRRFLFDDANSPLDRLGSCGSGYKGITIL